MLSSVYRTLCVTERPSNWLKLSGDDFLAYVAESQGLWPAPGSQTAYWEPISPSESLLCPPLCWLTLQQGPPPPSWGPRHLPQRWAAESRPPCSQRPVSQAALGADGLPRGPPGPHPGIRPLTSSGPVPSAASSPRRACTLFALCAWALPQSTPLRAFQRSFLWPLGTQASQSPGAFPSRQSPLRRLSA